jgi:hypothetical protein
MGIRTEYHTYAFYLTPEQYKLYRKFKGIPDILQMVENRENHKLDCFKLVSTHYLDAIWHLRIKPTDIIKKSFHKTVIESIIDLNRLGYYMKILIRVNKNDNN